VQIVYVAFQDLQGILGRLLFQCHIIDDHVYMTFLVLHLCCGENFIYHQSESLFVQIVLTCYFVTFIGICTMSKV